MSQELFLLAIKSTIDKLAGELATTEGLSLIDLDNTVEMQELFSSEDNAVVWEYGTLAAEPRDPLYMLTFNIGARTVKDSANYNILSLTGKVQELFKVCSRIEVKDYSGLVESGVMGYIMPNHAAVTPQQYDKVSGIRMMTVTARAQRLA